jgi:uncharacterized protein
MNDNGVVYFDTSALAKWYLNEARSEDVESYLQNRAPVLISDLTVIEFRCLLARRRRNGELDFALENRIFSTFQEDIRLGHLECSPVPDGVFSAAVNLISVVTEAPLRTQDALHLAIARALSAETVATADQVIIRAADALGLSVARFD